MPQSDHRGVSAWLRHRLTLIVYAEDLNAAREVLRCTRYDLNLRLHHLQEQALGTPPLKWAISTRPRNGCTGWQFTLRLCICGAEPTCRAGHPAA